MIKIENASWSGTRMNNLKLFVNNELAGVMDADHRRIELSKEFANIDEEELINALVDYDCGVNLTDRSSSIKEYSKYFIFVKEDDEEEY